MSLQTKIKVKTIGYYHRDREISRYNQFPPTKLDSTVEDSGAGEHYMESLLEYIRLRPWNQETKPHFVTNKNLLKMIASKKYNQIQIHCVRLNDVIFMLKKTFDTDVNTNFGAFFEHFMTKETENEKMEEDGTIRKAVFMAEIPMENKVFKVMYSGEIDAIDGNGHHYELKVLLGGMNHWFWMNTSVKFYWQSVLSGFSTLIIGNRTGKKKLIRGQDRHFHYLIIHFLRLLPVKVAQFARTWKKEYEAWTVEDGENEIQEFLRLVSERLTQNEDCFKFSKELIDDEWNIERENIEREETKETKDFHDLIAFCVN
uniref:Decapping nuclease n=1 Tax=Caenorhabditis tropicalis TaxID=1561998 RepID=A0A1I7UGZ8_9PELO